MELRKFAEGRFSMILNSLVTPVSIILLIFLLNKPGLTHDMKASVARNLLLFYTFILALLTETLGFMGFWNNFSNIYK